MTDHSHAAGPRRTLGAIQEHVRPSRRTTPGKRQLTAALVLTSGFLFVEVAAAFVSGSLALMADAGHMLADVVALALSLMAVRVGTSVAGRRRTFQFRQAEVLAATVNAGLLFAVGLYVVAEAARRLAQPVEVQSAPMLVVAFLGMVVSLLSVRLISGVEEGRAGLRPVYLNVMGNLLGSGAVILGALALWFTGWTWIDPALGALIGLWVLPRTWSLLRASVNGLMECPPESLDLEALRQDLGRVSGVVDVRDLHVWSVSSGVQNLTVHLVARVGGPALVGAVETVAQRYGVEHSTVQLESS
ncbi:cation diffusion facilitator family transporter [Deinococcus taeanensis]|uniref:cation diffusion facilitator family transporter n=1 Tax=Deinococcus taeanensis TaxID=2737050 RepID=UPI001CDB6875|nr:cation diffusion facilitator family transporter [Deinococcus taeanensis]UBV41719.1 cation diffusion facilitator family transporter [Deinococcus taeanensis]